MNRHALAAAALAAVLTAAAGADPIDACALLSDAEIVALGLPTGSIPSHELQPGGVQACRYRFPNPAAADAMLSVSVSPGVPDRVLQFRALLAKAAAESTPAQQHARGEYVEGDVMCKVVSASRLETSRCIGAAGQSVVAFSMSRHSDGDEVAYPAAQLQTIAALLSRALPTSDRADH